MPAIYEPRCSQCFLFYLAVTGTMTTMSLFKLVVGLGIMKLSLLFLIVLILSFRVQNWWRRRRRQRPPWYLSMMCFLVSDVLSSRSRW